MRSAQSIFEDLGLCMRGAEIDVESLPFSASDITAGSESELQAISSHFLNLRGDTVLGNRLSGRPVGNPVVTGSEQGSEHGPV